MPFMIEVYASQNTFISRNQIYQYLLNTCNMQSTIAYGPCKHREAGATVRFTGCDLPDHIMSLPVPKDFFPLDGRKDTWCGSYNKESPER